MDALVKIVIATHARGMNRAGIGIARGLECQPIWLSGSWINQVRSVGERKAIEKWLQPRHDALPRRKRRDLGQHSMWLAKTLAFIGHKEERAISKERSPKDAAEIVLAFFRARRTIPVSEPIVGI